MALLVFLPAVAAAQDAVFGGLTITLGGGFSQPTGVAVDSSGNVYIADNLNTAILVMPPGCVSSACITTLGDGFNQPYGVAVDFSGNVYVADASNNAVKKIPPGCTTTACVSTLGGGFHFPTGVAVDSNGNIYVADYSNNAVKEMPAGCASSACVTSLGGGFGGPSGVAVDLSGNVYVADKNNQAAKEMPAGCASAACVTTLGGGFGEVQGVAVDASGNIYVADWANGLVKKMPAGCASSACVTTVGSGYKYPWGIAVDGGGNVYVGDQGNGVVSETMLESVNFFSEPVGSTSSATSVKFNFTSSVTISAVGFAPNFTLPSTGTCFTQNPTYTAGGSCTVDVQFSPKSPGPLYGAIFLYNNASPPAVIGTALVQGIGVAPQVVFSPSTTASLGGGFNSPFGIAVDSNNNVYVADSGNNAIKEMPPGCASASCAVSLGGGFSSPGQPAIDGAGNVYVPDYSNNAVKEMPPGCTSAACVTTLGGGFSGPNAVAVDGSGDVYVADSLNSAVKKIPPGCTAAAYSSGSCTITRLGGGFQTTLGVALDSDGNVYVADGGFSGGTGAVYKMPAGCASSACVTTLGGGFKNPYGVAVDPAGNVYVADYGKGALFEMPAGCTSSTCVTTLDSLGAAADVALDASGNVYAIGSGSSTDTELHRATPPTLTFATTPPDQLSADSPRTVTVQNIGNDTLNISNVAYSFDFTEDSGAPATDCPESGTLAAGKSCTLTIDFSPRPESVTGPSTLLSEPISLTDNNLNGSNVTQSVSVKGTETVNPAALSSPAPNSVLPGPMVSFLWNAGIGATGYKLLIGTTAGGQNLYNSGALTGTSASPANLPANGEKLYARLFTLYSSKQAYADYAFTAATDAALTSPNPGSVLAGPKVTFTWSAASGATAYRLWVGTSARSDNLYTSGAVTATSATPASLPVNGEKLYVTLVTVYGSAWAYSDFVYTAATAAALTSPTPGTVLPGPTVTFKWPAVSGVTAYRLWIGTAKRADNVYTSGVTTATSATPPFLPTNGEKLYVTLVTAYGSNWLYNDYVYTAATAASLLSPKPNSVLAGPKVTFTWNASPGATAYRLWIGTSARQDNVYTSGPITATSATPTSLPTNGEKLYVTLVTANGSNWVYADYVFTAARIGAPPLGKPGIDRTGP